MMTTLYKVLGPNAESIHGGSGAWFRPSGKRPGKWMPEIKDVRCCQRGYHLVEASYLPSWLRKDCTIWVAEGRGATHTNTTDKTAYAQARLLRRQYLSECDMRLFAADCAERVLPLFLVKRPNDDRPAKAIEAARRLARGEISVDDAAATRAAYAAYAADTADATHAAYAAADAYAPYAAYAADAASAHAASAADAAYAAYIADAAYAAHAAADAHAYANARTTERQWQGARLLTYLKDKP